MGLGVANDNEESSHQIDVAAFWIMQTEVTNAHFRNFVEGDGYSNNEYWTDAGQEWKASNAADAPAYWGDSRPYPR